MYCSPKKVNCTGSLYESNPEKYSTYTNHSVTLQAGEYCNITVDATQGIARVIFENYYPVDALGIME
jgi:hypothetical protein